MPAVKKNMKAKTDKRRRQRVRHTCSDGTVVVRWAQGKNDAELEQDIAKIKADLEREEQEKAQKEIADFDSTFKEYAIIWYERERRSNLSPASREMYLGTFKKHLFPVFGDIKIRDIKLHHIKDFVNTYENKVSKSTADKILMVMREVMMAAASDDIADQKIVLKWNEIKMPSLKESEERRPLTDAEREAAHWVGHNHEEGLYLLVLFHLGLRRGEALGLKWGDIDLATRLVHVRRDVDFCVKKNQGHLDKEKAQQAALTTDKIQRIGKLKNKSSRRTIPIFDDEFLTALIANRGADDKYLFVDSESGEPLKENPFRRMWVRLMTAMLEYAPDIEGKYSIKKVKVTEGGQVVKKNVKVKTMSMLTPHYFRHNFATQLYWAGIREMQAVAWMGHSDMTMINRIYAHLREGDSECEVKKMTAYLNAQTDARCANDVPKLSVLQIAQ